SVLIPTALNVDQSSTRRRKPQFRHPEVAAIAGAACVNLAAMRPSKDDARRAWSTFLLWNARRAVTLRGSLRSHLRVTEAESRTKTVGMTWPHASPMTRGAHTV